MNDKGHLANRIRELRKKLNLDAESFGRRIGRSGKSVSAWETGRNAPGVDVLENICRTYAVDIDYFFPMILQRMITDLTPYVHMKMSSWTYTACLMVREREDCWFSRVGAR